MMETTTFGPFETVLAELDELLSEEGRALQDLDHGAIDGLTARKLALLDKIGRTPRDASSPRVTALLTQLRQRALNNQLLIVHARDLVRGVIETSAPLRAGNGGSLLEVRG